MMLDPTTRLVVAYGLIALMLLAGLALLWRRAQLRRRRRGTRVRRAGVQILPSAPPAAAKATPIEQGIP